MVVQNVYTPLRRPQSLIVLPTTHAPPFVIGNPIKRPRSLPDLKRGDFADPSAEVDIVDVEVDYMSIPLPTPGPDEANELAELAEPEKELIQTSQSWDKPEEASIGRSLVEQAEDSPFTSSHMQTPVDTESKVDTKMSPHTGEVPQIVGIATATRQVLVPSVARYSQYEYDLPEVNPPRPKTPPVLHGTSFFCDEEDSPPPKRRASRILKESIGSISSSVEVGECMKHASSPGTGSSRPDRKIGHLHLVSTSSTYSERGTSVRVFTPPATPDKSRRSSSFSRPIHTSGSTSSQTSILKTLVSYGKHESDAESRSSHNSERLTSLDDKERSFEELISSGGTIHCTITPDPIRNMEVCL